MVRPLSPAPKNQSLKAQKTVQFQQKHNDIRWNSLADRFTCQFLENPQSDKYIPSISLRFEDFPVHFNCSSDENHAGTCAFERPDAGLPRFLGCGSATRWSAEGKGGSPCDQCGIFLDQCESTYRIIYRYIDAHSILMYRYWGVINQQDHWSHFSSITWASTTGGPGHPSHFIGFTDFELRRSRRKRGCWGFAWRTRWRMRPSMRFFRLGPTAVLHGLE